LARAAAGARFETEVALRDRGGGPRTLRVTGRARIRGGRIVGVAGLLRDMTDAQRRDAAIARHRARFDAILEGVESLIFIKDREGRLVMANRKYLDTACRDDVLGLTDVELWDSESAAELRAVDLAVFETGEPFLGEERVVTREGEEIIYLSSKFLLPDERTGEPVMCGIAADITEQKHMQRRLEESRRAAEEASRAKSRFLASMSHEIRTPLNGVLGMAELLSTRIHDPDSARMIDVIRTAGQSLLTIINDILDLSKIEADRLTIERAPFDPVECLRAVAAIHEDAARRKGLAFVLRAPDGPVARKVGDAHRIGQILHNLIGNAVKFTAAGSVTVALRAEPAALTFEVEDTGVGMDEAVAQRVFDEFTQADESTTRRFGGTGLGLSIVRRLASRMGGEVMLTSAPGVGSRFTVRLPAPAYAGAGIEQGAGPSAAPAAGLRVLVADDNPVNRMVMEGLLEQFGAAVTLADGGETAVERRFEGDFDVLLLDISMPGMDGVDALRAIRRGEAQRGLRMPPALAVTANAMPDQIAAYLQAGFVGHVAKPIGRDMLGAALVRWGGAPSLR
jgi:PAS domain S-box-containing protein